MDQTEISQVVLAPFASSPFASSVVEVMTSGGDLRLLMSSPVVAGVPVMDASTLASEDFPYLLEVQKFGGDAISAHTIESLLVAIKAVATIDAELDGKSLFDQNATSETINPSIAGVDVVVGVRKLALDSREVVFASAQDEEGALTLVFTETAYGGIVAARLDAAALFIADGQPGAPEQNQDLLSAALMPLATFHTPSANNAV